MINQYSLYLLLLGQFIWGSDTLKVGVQNFNYPPYYHYDDSQQYQGYMSELLLTWAQQTGYTIIFQPMPIETLFEKACASEIDFKVPDHPNWHHSCKESQPLRYSKTIADYNDRILTLASHSHLKTEDLKEVGVLQEFTPWPLYKQIQKGQLKLKEYPSVQALLQGLLQGEIKAVYINEVSARYVLQKQLKRAQRTILTHTQLPGSSSEYFISTRHHKKAIQRFNQWMAHHKQDVQKIKAKWGLSP